MNRSVPFLAKLSADAPAARPPTNNSGLTVNARYGLTENESRDVLGLPHEHSGLGMGRFVRNARKAVTEEDSPEADQHTGHSEIRDEYDLGPEDATSSFDPYTRAHQHLLDAAAHESAARDARIAGDDASAELNDRAAGLHRKMAKQLTGEDPADEEQDAGVDKFAGSPTGNEYDLPLTSEHLPMVQNAGPEVLRNRRKRNYGYFTGRE
jgi:hypothetical protein